MFNKPNKANNKLKEIVKQDISIVSKIVFTSATEFYYVFNVIRKGEIIDKVRANNSRQYDERFKELANKYEVNIIYDYSDLTYSQLEYLAGYKKDNRVESGTLEDIRIDNMFKM